MIDAFLEHLWRGGAWAVYQRPVALRDGGATFESRFPTRRPPAVPAAWADSDVYFSIHPGDRADRGRFRGLRICDLTALNCLYAEFDAKDFAGGKPAILAHLDRLWEGGLPFPSVVVDSGGGYHCYWLLENTQRVDPDNLDRLREIQRRWVLLWGGDRSADDLRRTLRVPGTVNHKPGRHAAMVAIHEGLSSLARLYEWERLTAHLPPAQVAPLRAATPHVAPTDRYGAAALAWATAAVRSTGEGSRNVHLFTEACGLFELANAGVLDAATVAAELTAAALDIELDIRESAGVIRSARRRTEGKQRTVPARAPMEVRW